MQVSGLNAVVEALRKRAARLLDEGDQPAVVVGYTAAYAVHVHEDLGAHHANGEAKFLGGPARELGNDGTLQGSIRQALERGLTLGQALLLAGLRLQRESQLRCPVLTGNLKNSAFTRLEQG